jgi:hypothetical protein
MKFAAKKKPNCASRVSRFAANFIQNLYTVLKKRLWESRSTPTLDKVGFFAISANIQGKAPFVSSIQLTRAPEAKTK